jgi:hypothetical protein
MARHRRQTVGPILAKPGSAVTIPAAIQDFWQAFSATVAHDPSERFLEVSHFDDNAPGADELAALVSAGTKRATASLVGQSGRMATSGRPSFPFKVGRWSRPTAPRRVARKPRDGLSRSLGYSILTRSHDAAIGEFLQRSSDGPVFPSRTCFGMAVTQHRSRELK